MTATAIYGPPGTGKTTFLTNLIGSLRAEQVADMAVVSFSKAAASELISRLKECPLAPGYVGTIHSFCFNQLQYSRGQVVSSIHEHPEFMEGLDRDDVAKAIEIGQLVRCKYFTLQDAYQYRSDLILSYDIISDIWDNYIAWKHHYGLIDFNDMLENAVSKTKRFGFVVVDEAQDLSQLQWNVVRSMVKPGGELWLGGDDDQAIFTWAGADPHGMAHNSQLHQTLTQSYRVPALVHRLAQKTVERIRQRHQKKYDPAPGQGYVSSMGEYDPNLFPFPHTIMCRDRYVMKTIEEELIWQGLPYRIDGAHGPGYFMGRKAKIVRAVRDKNHEALVKLRAYMSPRDRATVDLGSIPPLGSVMSHLDDVEGEYMMRVLDKSPEDVNITLSTIHAQKGKEFDHGVLIAHCSPRVESMQERATDFDDEIRVWYTAITRVKKGITIIGTNPYISQL